MLDLVWADTAANYYEPRGDLSGPHSRDYDTLLGHGIHYVELYAHGLPGSIPLRCEWEDPHCEGCAKPLADIPPLPFLLCPLPTRAPVLWHCGRPWIPPATTTTTHSHAHTTHPPQTPFP